MTARDRWPHPARAWRAVRELPPAAVLGGAWLVLALYAFPGQMSWDSFEYLHAARHGGYTDLHPPAVSALWAALETLVAGPSGMFVIQSAALLVGIYAILARSLSPRRAAWAAAALALFPPIAVPMAVIWAHSQMAGFLALGIAGLASPHVRGRLAGLAACALAVAMRPSAALAVLPPIVLLFELGSMPALRRYAVAAGAYLAVATVALGADALLAEREMNRWQSVRAVHDIAGVLRFASALPDAELAPILAGTELRVASDIQAAVRQRYKSRDAFSLFVGDGAPWDLPSLVDEPVPSAQAAALARARDHLIGAHRGAYVRHRIAVAKRVLGLVEREQPPAVLPRQPIDIEVSLGVGVPTHASELQHALTDAVAALARSTPLFVPWIYAVLALVMLPLAWRHRDLAALLGSGLAFEATLVVIATENDFRQSHWLVTATCVAIVSLVARRMRR